VLCVDIRHPCVIYCAEELNWDAIGLPWPEIYLSAYLPRKRKVVTKEGTRERLVDCLLLAAALFVAGFLRLYRLESLPPGPYYDEAANGILAGEIASGASRPLFIPAYTGKEVLYFYVAAAVMKVTGATLLGLRLTSVLLGGAGVVATYFMARAFFDADEAGSVSRFMRRGTPLFAAALVATSFWHVNMSRYGFRAISQPLTQALMWLFLWRGWRAGRWRDVVLGGLFCGATAYTYLASRAVPLALLPFLLGGLIVNRRYLGQRMGQVAVFLLSALAVFAPLGVYFMRHPQTFGVRMAQVSVFNPAVGGSEPWRALGQSAWKALGMFTSHGDPLWRFGVPGQPVFPTLISVLFCLGLVVSVIRIFVAKEGLVRVLHLSLLLWLPIMLLPSILGANQNEVPSSLRAIGVMPVLYLFPAQGLATVLAVARRWWRPVGEDFVVGVAVMALLLGSAFSLFGDYMIVWGRASQPYYGNDNDLADAARTLNQLELGERELFVSSAHYRHPTMAFMAHSYDQMRWLVGDQVMAFPPADGPGAVYTFPRSALPDEALLALLGTVAGAERHLGPDGDTAYLIYRLLAGVSPSIWPQYSLNADFGHQIESLGYDLLPATAGESLSVTLYWRVLACPEVGDYVVFAHLQDAWGFRWGSSDVFDYPSAEWSPGQIIVQRREVSLPAVAPPGDYALTVGFYSRGQGDRLPRLDTQGRVAGTTIVLGPVAVGAALSPPPVERLTIQQRAPADFGALRLLGFERDRTSIRQGEALSLGLFWQATDVLPDLQVALSLEPEAGGGRVPLWEGRPVQGTYPTDRWPKRAVVLDRYGLTLPQDTPAGEYALTLIVRDGHSGETVGEITSLMRLRVESMDRRMVVPPIHYSLAANLGDQVEFLGYDLDQTEVAPGETLHLTLYWRALAKIETSYTVFTHLLDGANQIRGQQDNPPMGGSYPTTLWMPGEVVTDAYAFGVDAGALPGEHVIEIGLYVAETGQRLPVLDAAGQVIGDRILLGVVQVRE